MLMIRIYKSCFAVVMASAFSSVAYAQQGFFLNDWKARHVTAPPFNEVTKPTAANSVTVTINPDNVITKVPKSLFGNNSNPYMTQMVTEPVLIEHIKAMSPNIIRFRVVISAAYFFGTLKST